MTNERKIGMRRLNPTHKVDNEVFMGFFPPTENYYNVLLQDENFKLFLMSGGTTKMGQDRIADYYEVGKLWEQMDKKECYYERYFQLLWLVETKSPVDFLWVSFVEGLHRHAATILALLCTKFDYENKIQPGSLSIQDFKAAKILHFVDLKISPEEQIKLIMNGQESLKMLKNTFPC
jgi:phosphotransferase system HPr-like phosphotransfer protein